MKNRSTFGQVLVIGSFILDLLLLALCVVTIFLFPLYMLGYLLVSIGVASAAYVNLKAVLKSDTQAFKTKALCRVLLINSCIGLVAIGFYNVIRAQKPADLIVTVLTFYGMVLTLRFLGALALNLPMAVFVWFKNRDPKLRFEILASVLLSILALWGVFGRSADLFSNLYRELGTEFLWVAIIVGSGYGFSVSSWLASFTLKDSQQT